MPDPINQIRCNDNDNTGFNPQEGECKSIHQEAEIIVGSIGRSLYFEKQCCRGQTAHSQDRPIIAPLGVEHHPGENCYPGDDGESDVEFCLPGKIFHCDFPFQL